MLKKSFAKFGDYSRKRRKKVKLNIFDFSNVFGSNVVSIVVKKDHKMN